MSKVKNETIDDEMFCNSIGIKQQPGEMAMDNNLLSQEIKEEPELIIKSEFEWLPTNLEDEQQEYYLEYHHHNKVKRDDDGYKLSTRQSDQNEHHEFSFRYIDENEGDNDGKHEGDEDDDDGDYNNTSNDEVYTEDGCSESENNSDDSYGPSKSKPKEKSENSVTSETFNQRKFKRWLCSQYIKNLCPICEKAFNGQPSLSLHLYQQHKDLIDKEISLNYNTNQASEFICKQCYKQKKKSSTLIVHSLLHSTPKVTLKLFECKICQEKLSTSTDTYKHIMEKHPDTKDTFQNPYKKWKKETHECPLCPVIYNKFSHLRFHFKDKHPDECGEIFAYPCHLCENTHGNFKSDQEFFEHLLEEHNLKDWTLMHFDFYPKKSDDPHFICTKCLQIFTEMDLVEFLRHYLEHINYNRLCRSCNNKYPLKLNNFDHMCHGWFKTFQSRAVKSNMEQEALSSWQDFEEYIKHICSFCNEEFETMQNWQIHLREIHQLDTLKGLQMEKIPNDSDRLKCNVCKTFVVNASVQLHTHCFQHLPYRPYKCRHCSRTFDNYKAALNHVLKKCQDQHNQTEATTFQESREIICPLCDNLKFSNRIHISKHFMEKHNNFINYFTKQLDNSMKCNVCQLQLANEEDQCINHILLHFARKVFKCLKCSQSFSTKSACYFHISFHLAKPINTKEISKNTGLSSSSNEQQELNDLKITIEQSTLEKGTTLKEFAEFISYACPECNESLETKQLWQEHINEKHDFFQEDDLAVKDPLDGSLKCSHCHLKVGQWSIAQKQCHKLLHMTYKAFICKICNYRGCSLSYMYTHLRNKHFAKGSHKCPICPVILTTPYDRLEHLKNTHPRSEWPNDTTELINLKRKKPQTKCNREVKLKEFVEFINYACPECNEHFITRETWQEHINEKHTFFQDHNLSVKDSSDGSLKCTHCPSKVASSFCERQKHKLLHMPFKAFICNLCSNSRFSAIGVMHSHLRKIHFLKGSYECPICKIILTTPHEKTEHLKNTHPHSEWPDLMCRICCLTCANNSSLRVHIRGHAKTKSMRKERTTKRNSRSNSPNTRKKIKMESE